MEPKDKFERLNGDMRVDGRVVAPVGSVATGGRGQARQAKR